MTQMLVKSQAGVRGEFATVAAAKLSCCFISSVVIPLTPAPPALRGCPEAVMSQKLLLAVPPRLAPTSPPTGTAPLTDPDE